MLSQRLLSDRSGRLGQDSHVRNQDSNKPYIIFYWEVMQDIPAKIVLLASTKSHMSLLFSLTDQFSISTCNLCAFTAALKGFPWLYFPVILCPEAIQFLLGTARDDSLFSLKNSITNKQWLITSRLALPRFCDSGHFQCSLKFCNAWESACICWTSGFHFAVSMHLHSSMCYPVPHKNTWTSSFPGWI